MKSRRRLHTYIALFWSPRARGFLALATAAAVVAALRRSPALLDRMEARPMAAIGGSKLLIRPNDVGGAPTHCVVNVVESFATAKLVSLHGLPLLLLLLLFALFGTVDGVAKISHAPHDRTTAASTLNCGSMLASGSRQWQMTLLGCLFGSRPAMTAVNVLDKADEKTPARIGAVPRAIGNFHAGEYEMLCGAHGPPPTFIRGLAREGCPPSPLVTPSAATTTNGALVAIDEAPYMSAGPGLSGRACGAL